MIQTIGQYLSVKCRTFKTEITVVEEIQPHLFECHIAIGKFTIIIILYLFYVKIKPGTPTVISSHFQRGLLQSSSVRLLIFEDVEILVEEFHPQVIKIYYHQFKLIN